VPFKKHTAGNQIHIKSQYSDILVHRKKESY